MFGRDVLVLEPRHLVERRHQHLAQGVAHRRLAPAELLGAALELGFEAGGERLRRHLEPLQQGWHQPVLLAKQREQEVIRFHSRVLQLLSRLLSRLQGFLGSFGETVEAHTTVYRITKRR